MYFLFFWLSIWARLNSGWTEEHSNWPETKISWWYYHCHCFLRKHISDIVSFSFFLIQALFLFVWGATLLTLYVLKHEIPCIKKNSSQPKGCNHLITTLYLGPPISKASLAGQIHWPSLICTTANELTIELMFWDYLVIVQAVPRTTGWDYLRVCNELFYFSDLPGFTPLCTFSFGWPTCFNCHWTGHAFTMQTGIQTRGKCCLPFTRILGCRKETL